MMKPASHYGAILSSAPADAPWVPLVKEQLAELDRKGVATAVVSLPPEDRQAAIKGMVESLAQRLATTGGTAEEWSRLVRSYAVLGEHDRARATLDDARRALAQDQAGLGRLDAHGARACSQHDAEAMTRKQRRFTLIGTALGVLGLALGLVLYAMRDNIVFFHAPADVAARGLGPGALPSRRPRQEGSIKRDGQSVAFEVMDARSVLPVTYRGILPDLFREGQGVVAEGMLDASGVFKADTVLARHDETYMPREVADALKQQGHWQGAQGAQAKR